MKRTQSVTRITIILSWEFLIWPRKRYPRPSHHPFMISSTLKCQVLILATLPLRGISSLMRNTGCHLHPRTRDTGEALSPPTWNLLHTQRSNKISHSTAQESESRVNVPRENQQLATVAELLTHRSLGTKRVVNKDGQKGARKLTTGELETSSQGLYLW